MNTKKPLLRGQIHYSMFFVSLGACLILIFEAQNTLEVTATTIYSIGLLLMFGISALYHRIHWNPSQRFFVRKLDHSAIYIMIAGTFTPITMLVLSSKSGTTLLIIIWVTAFLGILKSIFLTKLPKIFNALLYLIMGYMITPYLSELTNRLGYTNTSLIVLGGFAYSIGALSYALKRPQFNPKIFGYHEFFHAFVSLGAIIHFLVIYSIMN